MSAFLPKADMLIVDIRCPLCAKSGHAQGTNLPFSDNPHLVLEIADNLFRNRRLRATF